LANDFIATIAVNSSAIMNDHQTRQTVDYFIMLGRWKTFHRKRKNIDELKTVLQSMWYQLLQDSIN